jgi:hypothetical protein
MRSTKTTFYLITILKIEMEDLEIRIIRQLLFECLCDENKKSYSQLSFIIFVKVNLCFVEQAFERPI